MRNTILGLSYLKLGDIYYYPLKSTVHISHIAQHAVAGERHAFSLEEDRSQKTECWHAETAETREIARHFERSGAESRNPFTPKHCEERKISHRLHRFSQNYQSDDGLCSQASGLHGTAKRREETHRAKAVISSAAERSREILSCRSIAKKKSHADSADNADFQSDANRCPLMPTEAGWQISQNRTERKWEQSRYKSAGRLALASTKSGRKICDNQRNLREMIS